MTKDVSSDAELQSQAILYARELVNRGRAIKRALDAFQSYCAIPAEFQSEAILSALRENVRDLAGRLSSGERVAGSGQ